MPVSQQKRDIVYSKLVRFATSNNASLQSDIEDLDPNNNCWFVDISSINDYTKNLYTTLTEIKGCIEGTKDQSSKYRSRSLKILNDLIKLTPKGHFTASEKLLNEAEKLSNKLRKIGRLSFFGSFGASLNSGKSIKLLNGCGKILGEAIKRAKLKVKRIQDKSNFVIKKMNDISSLSKLSLIKKAFNSIVSTMGSNWIFNDCTILTLDSNLPNLTPWNLKRINATKPTDIAKKLVDQLTELRSLIEIQENKPYRYSPYFQGKVLRAISQVSSLKGEG